jgi:MOB kinase activator 1
LALAQAVKLPKDENLNEWLAVHVVDFYNQINMLYGTITEFCSPKTCPRMIATNEYEYLWQDSNISKPVSVSAPKYVESLMTWIQSLFDDENIFPSKLNQPFPPQFQSLVKTIMKRLFRIYAHIYCHHFNEVIDLGLNTLLNTSFKHFLLFADEFNLIAQKDYGPLQTLVMEMLIQDQKQ